MKRALIFMVLLLVGHNSMADSESKALKSLQKALSKIPAVKKKTNYVKRRAINALPVDKETAVLVGGVTLTLVEGKIDTKDLKKLDVGFFGGTIRPDLEYDFKNDQASGFLNFSWSLGN